MATSKTQKPAPKRPEPEHTSAEPEDDLPDIEIEDEDVTVEDPEAESEKDADDPMPDEAPEEEPPPPPKKPARSVSANAALARGRVEPPKPASKPAAKPTNGNGKKPVADGLDDAGGFDDESIQSGGQYLGRYRAKKGYRDRIRLLPFPGGRKGPFKIRNHYKHPRIYANCTRKWGDESVPCPVCDNEALGFEESKETLTTAILHIERKQGDTTEGVGKVLNWTFGKDKYTLLRDIIGGELKERSQEAGKDLSIWDVDLIVTAIDADKQVLSITVASQSKLTKSLIQKWKDESPKFLECLDKDFKAEAITAGLARTKRGGRNGGGGDDFAEGQGGRRNSGGKRRGPEVEEDERDVDADLDDLTKDLE